MRRSPRPVILGVLLVSACTGITGEDLPISDPSTTTSSISATSTVPPVVECPGAGDFGEGGGIATVDGEGTDSSTLGHISWQTNARCESFDFDFETSEGAPATTVPEISIDHLESYQVIRIRMDVGGAVLTDQLVETALVERLYVVNALDGGMFIDLHLSAPAAARARVESSPARLTVDLRPGFVPFTGESAVGDDTVVVSPVTGAAVGSTEFTGYARVPDGAVTIIVTQGEDVVSEIGTTTADTSVTWGEFTQEAQLPTGTVSVFVGAADVEDGSLQGITLDLAVS